MGYADHPLGLDQVFTQIEESILPGISMMLDTLLDASTLAQPGLDAEVYAAELRTIACQLDSLARDVESMAPVDGEPQAYQAVARA